MIISEYRLLYVFCSANLLHSSDMATLPLFCRHRSIEISIGVETLLYSAERADSRHKKIAFTARADPAVVLAPFPGVGENPTTVNISAL